MPIRPENKARYPKEWPEIRERILKRARNRCEECGLLNGARGFRTSSGTFVRTDSVLQETESMEHGKKIFTIVLTIAHLDHTPENCADDNLRAWCQRCHNTYDAPMRAAGRAERKAAGVQDLQMKLEILEEDKPKIHNYL